jgi:hypothetical protein
MALVMGWIARSRLRPRPSAQEGMLVQPVATLAVGVVSLIFWLAILIVSTTIGRNSTTTVWTVLLFGGFALASTPFIAWYYLGRHYVSARGMNYGSIFGRRCIFEWSDVRIVHFSEGNKWFRLQLSSGAVARVSAMLIGLPEFARHLLAHVPRERISDDAYEILRRTREGNLPNIWGPQ